MSAFKLTPFRIGNQIFFATGSMSFNMLERLILLYIAYFYLGTGDDAMAAGAEKALHPLIPDEAFWGFITAFGVVMVVGRVFDAIADPIIAQLSDNSKSRLGRRKLYMVIGALPLAAAAALAYFPPIMDSENLLNAVWLGLMVCVFYFGFTAFVNPYLALISELGQTESTRINISTFIALFGLVGMVLVMVLFPLVVGMFEDAGFAVREAYQWSAAVFAAFAMIFAYLTCFSFNEKKHCLPPTPIGLNVWQSLKMTYSIKHYRTFLAGELCVYFCVNIITMGLVYYAVVIFRGGQQLGIEAFMGDQFMMVIAGAALLVAMFTFPVVNILSKKIGKKPILVTGMCILLVVTSTLYFLSGNLEGTLFYVGIAIFALAGIPLAALTTLLFSTLSDIAREDAMRTGKKREGMFYGARAVPLKIVVAISGVVFGYLLSLGRSVENPTGVEMSLLVISLVSFLGLICFARYPEKSVLESLSKHEEGKIEMEVEKPN